LFERLKAAESLKPTFTLSKLLALIVALLVHGVTLSMFIVGILFIPVSVSGLSTNCFGLLPLFCGVTLFGFAWFARPRLGKAPEDIAPRGKFPALYGFVDEVADAIGASRVDSVVINEYRTADLAAGFRRSGSDARLSIDDAARRRTRAHAHELARRERRLTRFCREAL
jgi:hypothetical protein